MPLNFTPNLIPKFDSGLLRYINENFQSLKRLLASAPVETISATAPSNPYIGQPWYDTGDKVLKSWSGTKWTPGWDTTYVPTLTQTGAVAKTTAYSAYYEDGKDVYFEALLQPTGAGTAGGTVVVSLPFTAASAGSRAVGSGFYADASANANYSLMAYLPTTTTLSFITAGTAAAPAIFGSIQAARPGFLAGEAIANGDALSFNMRCKLA